MPPAHHSAPGPERPRTRPELLFRRVGEDWVVFDADGQRLHVLNLAAALVWSHCTGTMALDEIEDAVRAAYDDDLPDAGVRLVIEEFRAAGLLLE